MPAIGCTSCGTIAAFGTAWGTEFYLFKESTRELPMARSRNLHRIDLYCPQYKTHATILIDENHGSGGPYLVAHYEKGGLKGQMQFAAAIPAHWGDNDLVELIFLPAEKRENANWPTWEVSAREHGSSTLFKFWKVQKAE
jgi:hypothetical protein